MTGRLTGTVAIVTGASSGIGESTAEALAGEGAAIALVARRVDRLDTLAARIRDAGGTALPVEADLTREGDAESAVARAVDEFGRLDIVVNNAGVMLLGLAVDSPLEEWDRMVELNIRGTLHLTYAALPHLRAAATDPLRRVADLVTVSSVAGRRMGPEGAVYHLTKWGANAFSESLRQEITREHVRVGLVEPGATATELTTHLRPDVRASRVRQFADVEELDPADIADAIRYMVTRPRHMGINEILIRPTEQVR